MSENEKTTDMVNTTDCLEADCFFGLVYVVSEISFYHHRILLGPAPAPKKFAHKTQYITPHWVLALALHQVLVYREQTRIVIAIFLWGDALQTSHTLPEIHAGQKLPFCRYDVTE